MVMMREEREKGNQKKISAEVTKSKILQNKKQRKKVNWMTETSPQMIPLRSEILPFSFKEETRRRHSFHQTQRKEEREIHNNNNRGKIKKNRSKFSEKTA